jgi:protein-tyrosine phosphatase
MLRRRFMVLALAAAAVPARAAEPVKIAFVDTGNTGRSLMAEMLARALIAKGALPIAVISRGLDLDPFDEAPEPNARTLLAERGLDVAAHRARRLDAADVAHADLILTMTPAHAAKVIALFPEAKAKTFVLAAFATGADEPIPDAWGKPMAVYQAVVAQLDRLLPLALVRATAGRR